MHSEENLSLKEGRIFDCYCEFPTWLPTSYEVGPSDKENHVGISIRPTAWELSWCSAEVSVNRKVVQPMKKLGQSLYHCSVQSAIRLKEKIGSL